MSPLFVSPLLYCCLLSDCIFFSLSSCLSFLCILGYPAGCSLASGKSLLHSAGIFVPVYPFHSLHTYAQKRLLKLLTCQGIHTSSYTNTAFLNELLVTNTHRIHRDSNHPTVLSITVIIFLSFHLSESRRAGQAVI